MNIEIRRMQEDDMEIIINMFDLLYKHLNLKGFVLELNLPKVEVILQSILDADFFRVFVAEADGQIAGFISVNISKINTKFKTGKSKFIGSITELFVFDNYRGNDIGKLLVAEARKFFTKNNIEFVQVNTMSKNTEAINFYRGLGFSDDYVAFIECLI